MLKLLVVDDEEFVVDGMKSALDWQSLGVELVGTAYDGQEALEFIRKNEVDILITDIKMPVMDGLELIEHIRCSGLDCRIVVLTGYEEFDYAKRAISYKVSEYLLKPVILEKLEEAIKKVVSQCNSELTRRFREKEMEQKLNESLPLLVERYYTSLLNGVCDRDMQDFLGLTLKADRYKVVVVHIDNIDSLFNSDRVLAQREKQLLFIKICDLLKEFLQNRYDAQILNCSNNVAILFMLRMTDGEDELEDFIRKMQGRILDFEGVSVSVGLGRCYRHMEDICKSYEEAQQALKHKLYYGNGSIISYRDVRINQGSYVDYLSNIRKELTDSINLRDEKKAVQILQQVQKTLESENRLSIEYIKKLSMELVLILSLALYDKNESLEKIYVKRPDALAHLARLETIADIFNELKEIYTIAIQYLNKRGEIKNKNVIEQIIQYVQTHLKDEITLEEVAKKVYLTPNYVGYVFKESMGMCFSEYVQACRMEAAQRMLKEPGCKIYEVALKVGYKNPHYFSKLFREHTGCNPSDYKG